MESDLIKEVIVVGAGVSGLSAANFLCDKGVTDVLVLEANERVGGRTLTLKNKHVNYVDLGGSYIGVTQNHLHRLLNKFNIQTYKVEENLKILFYDSKRGLRYTFNPKDPFKIGNFIENLDLNNFLRKLDELGSKINVKEPWNSEDAKKLDFTSIQEFIDQTCYTRAAKNVAKNIINLNVTCEPYEASILWFAWYIRQCGGLKRIFATTGGGQDSKTIGGMQQLSFKLAENIGYNKIKLDDGVNYICYDFDLNGIKCCKIITTKGNTYYAKKLILALAPCMQNRIIFKPALSPMRIQMMQRYPMGTVMKCIIYYKTRFWQTMGYSGSTFLLDDDPEKAPLFYTLDDTKPDGSKPAIIGFLPANKLRTLIHKSKEERRDMIARSLYNALQNESALYPCHYEEHTMLNEPNIGGCYTSYAPPGFLTNFGHLLRENIDKKIFFAGTETSFNWSGYINGAIDSGERAAREILFEFKKLNQNEIFIEEPYLDEYPRFDLPSSFYEKYAPSVSCLIKFCLLNAGLGCLVGLVMVGKHHYSVNFNLFNR